MQAIAADFQPAFQQVELRAFPGAVDAFHDDQRPRVLPGGLQPQGGLFRDFHRIGGRLLNR